MCTALGIPMQLQQCKFTSSVCGVYPEVELLLVVDVVIFCGFLEPCLLHDTRSTTTVVSSTLPPPVG